MPDMDVGMDLSDPVGVAMNFLLKYFSVSIDLCFDKRCSSVEVGFHEKFSFFLFGKSCVRIK